MEHVWSSCPRVFFFSRGWNGRDRILFNYVESMKLGNFQDNAVSH